jgi:hypothetical protein
VKSVSTPNQDRALTLDLRRPYDPAPVNAAALPYTTLILLVEVAVGALAFVTLFDARRMVTMGYVQMGALIAGPATLLAVLLLRGVAPAEDVDGYALAAAWLPALRLSLYVLLALTVAHGLASFAVARRASLVLGVLGIVAGVGVIAILAGFVSPPAWSYLGVLLSLLAGALALGGSLMAMSWGHWYLTNSGLPKEPLEQMSLLVAAALVVQSLLLVVGLIAPVRAVPLGDASLGVALVANPAFWLRVGVGLLAPFVLAVLAYRAASIRGMMSATGLLYIAVGGVLAGEVLARGLLFVTGIPV